MPNYGMGDQYAKALGEGIKTDDNVKRIKLSKNRLSD